MRPASRAALILTLTLGLTACSDKSLHNLSDPTAGPEEFSILPNKPLEEPKDYAALPAPTPGSANRVDATPKEDAVAALGGKPARLGDTGVARADSALVASASRYGVPANIRDLTSEEDAAFRKRRGRFTNIRLFKVDNYAAVYKNKTLDSNKTIDAYRRANRKTPSAPPSN